MPNIFPWLSVDHGKERNWNKLQQSKEISEEILPVSEWVSCLSSHALPVISFKEEKVEDTAESLQHIFDFYISLILFIRLAATRSRVKLRCSVTVMKFAEICRACGKMSLWRLSSKKLSVFLFLSVLSLLIVKVSRAYKELDNFTKILINIVFY